MIPNWGQKSSACLAKRDFKSRDERFGVFWFFTKWTDISLKSKTLGKSWIKKSQNVRTKIFLLCWKSSEKQDTRQTPGFYAPSKVVEDAFSKAGSVFVEKSRFNCFNFFQFKGNLCLRKSVLHARKKRFRGLITK